MESNNFNQNIIKENKPEKIVEKPNFVDNKEDTTKKISIVDNIKKNLEMKENEKKAESGVINNTKKEEITNNINDKIYPQTRNIPSNMNKEPTNGIKKNENFKESKDKEEDPYDLLNKLNEEFTSKSPNKQSFSNTNSASTSNNNFQAFPSMSIIQKAGNFESNSSTITQNIDALVTIASSIDMNNSFISKLYKEASSGNVDSKFKLACVLIGPEDYNYYYPYSIFKDVLGKVNKDLYLKVKISKESGFKILDSLKEKNLPHVLDLLGICYEKGYGVKQEYKKALESFREGNRHKYLACKVSLSRFYFYGYELKKSETTADDMIKSVQVALNKDFSTMIALSLAYLRGEGVKMNLDQAYKNLAELGKNFGGNPLVLKLQEEFKVKNK